MAKQYRENLQQTENQPTFPTPPKAVPKGSPIQATSYRGTEKDVLDILKGWQSENRKKTPWGHVLVTKGKYTQSALIDACLCVEGGMSRERIARNSGVRVARVLDHIGNGLKIGRRNNGKAVKVKSRYVNGEANEYIDSEDQS